MRLGELRIHDFLLKTNGKVRGNLHTDGKDRYYTATYDWGPTLDGYLGVSKQNGNSTFKVPEVIELDEKLVVFFALYSGDGAKGSEDRKTPGLLRPNISFSQYEPNLIRFAVKQFRRVFPDSHFTFTIGEDSALFMAGEGKEMLREYYNGTIPPTQLLSDVRPNLSRADHRYLEEPRRVQKDPENDLAFYYQHKNAMEHILREKKRQYLINSGIQLGANERVSASIRRPYKKGAREPGGSSRSDETHVGGASGAGELFLKMVFQIEATIYADESESSQGLVIWQGNPSSVGRSVDVVDFFSNNAYGKLDGERPSFSYALNNELKGLWPRSKRITLKRSIKLDPLWCYGAGLYLAEGSTTKHKFFDLYRGRPSGLSLGFTGSDNTSIAIVLRALRKLFPRDRCLRAWKLKVGSQYFPELVMIGLKNAVPMLRGGKSGDGKLRTMEISLETKEWALKTIPAIRQYSDRFTHVEPTGAGLPRVDFRASSTLCKWYFPLVLYTAFGDLVTDPVREFTYD